MALDLRQNFVSAQYLENKLTEFHQIFILCIHIDKISVWIVTHHFSYICTRVMALDLRHNFVYAIENKSTDFHKILYILLTRSSLGLLHIFFRTLVLAVYLCQNFFSAQYLEISSFSFLSILTRSSLELLAVIFCLFITEL